MNNRLLAWELSLTIGGNNPAAKICRPPEFFTSRSHEWQGKLTGLQAKIDGHDNAHTSYLNEGIELLELSQRDLERYNEYERAEKRRILNLLLSNSRWTNATLILDDRQPFDKLAVNRRGQIRIAPSFAEEGDSNRLVG